MDIAETKKQNNKKESNKKSGVGKDGEGQNIDYSSSSSIRSEGRFASANASCQRCFVRADLNFNSDSMLRI